VHTRRIPYILKGGMDYGTFRTLEASWIICIGSPFLIVEIHNHIHVDHFLGQQLDETFCTTNRKMISFLRPIS
jgi:hypothetical protein